MMNRTGCSLTLFADEPVEGGFSRLQNTLLDTPSDFERNRQSAFHVTAIAGFKDCRISRSTGLVMQENKVKT
jgi:hypothetical protein